MQFDAQQRVALLALHGVGPTVIKRFEQIGITSFAELKQYRAEDIADMVAKMLHTTCWKNSPQAKAAINAAIELAKRQA